MTDNSNLTLIKFSSSSCFPCKQMKPILDKVLQEFIDINYVDINVDEDPDMAREYCIRSVPTLVLINKTNNNTKRLVGSATTNQIRSFLIS